MADQGINKVTILKKDLPNYIGNNESLFYNIKYRIISEDRNRTSHWSPFYKLGETSTLLEVGFNPSNPYATSVSNNIVIDKTAHTISISWTLPALLIVNPTDAEKILQAEQAKVKDFDIYVRWKSGSVYSDWQYQGDVHATSFSMSYSPKVGAVGPDYVQIAVQKITQQKQRWDAATYLLTQDKAL
jgi:hypothetical protein